MGLIDRLARFGQTVPPGDALYRTVVAEARRADWYRQGGVPDTVDGRFDMVALLLSLVLRRLEALPGAGQLAADVTDRFIADMDGSLRQLGVGDQVVGKEVGKMVSALGGRLGAYRDALGAAAAPSLLGEALARNLYRGAPDLDAAGWTARRVRELAAGLDAVPLERLRDGALA